MNLTPTEIDRLLLFQAAAFARRNREHGIRLSQPEAVALIADQAMLWARQGLAHEDIVDRAGRLLSTDDVMPGVADMVGVVSAECSFAEGTKLVVVFDPIGPGDLPIEPAPKAGEIITPPAAVVETGAGRDRITIDVVNTGDRDVQVRSHTHFFEVNRALRFPRRRAFGRRLDVPSGTGVRFEPGVAKTVDLIPFAGERAVFGFAGLVDGPLDDPAAERRAAERAHERGYLDL
ncbi:MAG: urease subunit beta [Pseudomonadota bacterium]